MSTHVVNEFHAKPGREDDVLALLIQLSPESQSRPGCDAISIRRNQDDPDNVIGDTRWATRQHDDDYLAWRTESGYTARFDQMLSEPMLIRYFDEIPFAPQPARPRLSPSPPRQTGNRPRAASAGSARSPEAQYNTQTRMSRRSLKAARRLYTDWRSQFIVTVYWAPIAPWLVSGVVPSAATNPFRDTASAKKTPVEKSWW
jgi:quinol monooxygenase YgiN